MKATKNQIVNEIVSMHLNGLDNDGYHVIVKSTSNDKKDIRIVGKSIGIPREHTRKAVEMLKVSSSHIGRSDTPEGIQINYEVSSRIADIVWSAIEECEPFEDGNLVIEFFYNYGRPMISLFY